jgi:hypothetical protein
MTPQFDFTNLAVCSRLAAWKRTLGRLTALTVFSLNLDRHLQCPAALPGIRFIGYEYRIRQHRQAQGG